MANLLTIEAETLCRRCNRDIGIYRAGACAFRSCGGEYCDRIEDIDSMIVKLLKFEYGPVNKDKIIQEQPKNKED